jgi:site-specific DNA-methyltransferase (adenine-specific)
VAVLSVTDIDVTLEHGDCAELGSLLPPESVHLVYLDPPFNTGKDHRLKSGALAFSDKWGSPERYISYWAERIAYMWEAVAPGCSLVLHVDPRSSHRFRVELERSMGLEPASEIVWRYRRWPSKTPNFQRVHDVLLRYVRPGAEPRFNQLYEPLAASTVATWGMGRQRALVNNDGQRVKSSVDEDDPSPGVPLGDVWDIGVIAPVSKERTGYPTQKPEKLLQRLVEALTYPGDTVVDPCFGSGTTLAVARRLQRRAIGCDSSDVAHATARKRLGMA